MKIATWNLNSIRARLERLLAWLRQHDPDVLCLQELKVADQAFPHETIREAGYHAAVFGQKTYNGVAILSRTEPQDVERGIDDGVNDPQARFLSARVGDVRVVSIYVPNGQEVGSDKYAYKLDWLRRFRAYLDRRFSPSDALIVCGDTNVAVDEKDAANPDQWADSVLCHADARAALRDVLDWGLVDVLRRHHPEGGLYSWWDYRMLAFPKNNGLRIDHILATPPLANRCTSAEIDRDERKGAKPSDHAPTIAEFDC
ncbi:MAG: exodeoxyribonuclease III [Phycisphaerae bacterium]|nr:exodeoxyribonuclease III [Phycisphaerae bacterium]